MIIDVPGERRYCRHCMDVTHTKSNCRQGQRVRARQQQLLRQQQQFDQQQQLDQQQPLNTGETQNADDAFGSGYTAPERTVDTTTSTTDDDAASVRSAVPHRWDDAMDLEVVRPTPATLQTMQQEAMRLINLAAVRPDEVDPTELATARQFLANAATYATRGHGAPQ